MSEERYTVGKLGELFGLSRTALLYYDSIGLLAPTCRTAAGYRLYSAEARKRLEQIVVLRSLGVPLERMPAYLDRQGEGKIPVLLRRLFAINGEITRLREQQLAILDLIERDGSLAGIKPRMHLLEDFGAAVGVTKQNWRELHCLFESASPGLHRRFLKFLGFTPKETQALLDRVKKA